MALAPAKILPTLHQSGLHHFITSLTDDLIHDDVIKWKALHITSPLWEETIDHRSVTVSNALLWCFLRWTSCWEKTAPWLSCDTHFINMMTSSNGNIFRVTGHLCGEFTGPGEFPAQRPVTRSFDVFCDLSLNKRLSKQSRGWSFETQSHPLWRHCNETCVYSSHGVTCSR